MQNTRLDNLVRLAVSAQIVVATLLLCLGERNLLLLAGTLIMLAVSWYVTDFTRRFALKQNMADLAALVAVAISALAVYRSDRQGLLISVANLQSYLQFVLLFQRKTPRVYWQLALLSLGQVAIASTLVPGPAFGVLLLAYVFLGMVSFSLLLVDRESARIGELQAGPALAVAGSGMGSAVLVGNCADAEPRDVLRGMLWPSAIATALTAVVGSLLFFALPRWNVPNYEASNVEPLRTVGFSKTVTLGELGEVVNNADVVMRIQFFRGYGSSPMKLEGEPLLRGTVVTHYDKGTWRQGLPLNPVMLPHEPKGTITRQVITAQPLDVAEMFCVFPVFALDQPDSRLRVDGATNQLIRGPEYRRQTIDIEVGTTGIAGNRQRNLVPSEMWIRRNEMAALREMPDASDAEGDPGLRALAREILEQKNIDAEQDPAAAAKALSDYFHLSGQFFYSLDPQARDVKLDPLEDFVTLHRSGHCEYFAGALVLMLRSLGIPARMAIGFKGGEWNSLGNYYQVQQLHAHAWVEAYLKRDQAPEGLLSNEESPYGAWLILDPTEGTQEGGATTLRGGFFARISQTIDYARVLWINYVASLNAKRQRQGIYEPLAAGVDAAVENLTSQQVWAARVASLEESKIGQFWLWYRRHWFSWRGGLVAIGFSSLLVALAVAARWLVRWLKRRGWLGRRRGDASKPVLEMYRRLEAALAKGGIQRQPAQTAHEFALFAGGELAEHVTFRRVAHLPRRVVESFYRVRFGGRTLDNQEAEAVEHALAQLESALASAQ